MHGWTMSGVCWLLNDAPGHQRLPQSFSPAQPPPASTLARLFLQRSRSLHWSSLNFIRLLLAHPFSLAGPWGEELCCCCSWNDFANLVHALESLQHISEGSSKARWLFWSEAGKQWLRSKPGHFPQKFSGCAFDLYCYFVNGTFLN